MSGMWNLELIRRGAMIELFQDLPFYRSHLQIYLSLGPLKLSIILFLSIHFYLNCLTYSSLKMILHFGTKRKPPRR